MQQITCTDFILFQGVNPGPPLAPGFGYIGQLLLLFIIITYDAIKVTLHYKLLQGHCKEFEFEDVHTLYANLAVRR